MIASSAILYAGVKIGRCPRIEDYCIVGAPSADKKDDSDLEETIIGDDAVIRSCTIIYHGNVIGHRLRTGNKANIRERNVMGDDVSIGTLTVIEHHVRIGNRVRIHSQAFIPEYSILEDDAWVGPHAVLTNARFPLSPGAKDRLTAPILERRAKIGANVTLLPGVRIGSGSLIGAGSLVTKDIPPGVIAAGVPAKVIREIDY